MKSAQITIYGPPGLIEKMHGMFELADEGVNFIGIGVDGMCLGLPKCGAVNQLCRLRLRCSETGKKFETCGYGSKSFVTKALRCDGKTKFMVAGERRALRKNDKKSDQHKYILNLEVIEG